MTEQEYIAHAYHSIFDYRLTASELKKWQAGDKLSIKSKKRIKKLKLPPSKHPVSEDDLRFKKDIATRAARDLSQIPFVLFVGISGSLAMNNAKHSSDIDLFIITKKDTLWITRLCSLALLYIKRFQLRSAHNKNEQNKICLNLWIDQSALTMPDMPQNAYTAHEIAQVVPLYHKMGSYSQWILKNKWISGYWPYAVAFSPKKLRKFQMKTAVIFVFLNAVFYLFQRIYMNNKITREKVTLHYAYFHPFDWGVKVMNELQKKGIGTTSPKE